MSGNRVLRSMLRTLLVSLVPVAAVAQAPSIQTPPIQAPAAQASIAPRPPMGWNSWNHFAGRVTDADVRAAADMLVSTGMKDAGYTYVNLDDTWEGTRDATGLLHTNERFPDMKALAAYVHSKGLKFGIYSSPGVKTCGGYAGSFGHEKQDARMYADWDVDFLKYDLCSFEDLMHTYKADHPDDSMGEYRLMIDAYRKMGDALGATGRPILFSLCQYGLDEPWHFGPAVGAGMWRTTDDINDSFARMILIAYEQVGLERFAGPGHWNDPDMLEVGNGRMTTEEYRTHMSLWALLAAPLLAGNDLGQMSAADKEILTNREVIAIDQDALGKQATRILQRGDFSVWSKPLSDGRTAIGMVNAALGNRDLTFTLAELGFPGGANVRDVWANQHLGRWSGPKALTIPQHGVKLYLFSR